MKPEMIEKIRVKMAEKDWSNKDLAREIGITDASVSRILAGKQKTGKETLEKIYNVLDIDEFSVNTLHEVPIKTFHGRYAMLRLSRFAEIWPPTEDSVVMTTTIDPSEFDETGYFYKVRDGSCSPVLLMGDVIMITYVGNAPIGDMIDRLCAVNYQGNDILRIVRKRDGEIWLDPINRDDYNVIKTKQADVIKVLGIVDYVSKRSLPTKF